MNLKDMREDLNYLVDKIKSVHIGTFEGLNKNQINIIEQAYKSLSYKTTLSEFIFIVNPVIVSLNDVHSRLEVNFQEGDKYLDIKCLWLDSGVYVVEDSEFLKKGDEIVGIGGKGISYIFKDLANLIPHQNDYIIKSKAFNMYNKMSFLWSDLMLNHLGLVDGDEVNLKINRMGDVIELNLKLKDYTPQSEDEEWLKCFVDKENNCGVFKLDQCIFNKEYKVKLRSFFDDIVNKNIENIIIDLRNNMGGDSRVCNEFFKYLDIDKYKEYRIDERVSRDTIEVYRNIFNENYNANEGYIKCEEKDIVIENVMYEDFKGKFKGNIYVIVSNTTFSSARIFAVLVKDNNLGKIVGEPTGGKPSSYGNVLRYKMPNFKVKFSLSTKNFRRPDSSKDDEESLYPDIEAFTTIEDIIDEKDTQIEMIKSLIRRGIK